MRYVEKDIDAYEYKDDHIHSLFVIDDSHQYLTRRVLDDTVVRCILITRLRTLLMPASPKENLRSFPDIPFYVDYKYRMKRSEERRTTFS